MKTFYLPKSKKAWKNTEMFIDLKDSIMPDSNKAGKT